MVLDEPLRHRPRCSQGQAVSLEPFHQHTSLITFGVGYLISYQAAQASIVLGLVLSTSRRAPLPNLWQQSHLGND
jgi:hypothetical protein